MASRPCAEQEVVDSVPLDRSRGEFVKFGFDGAGIKVAGSVQACQGRQNLGIHLGGGVQRVTRDPMPDCAAEIVVQ